MKLSQKVSGIKRVFVSIKERTSIQTPTKPIQPKPPAQPARFIRKRTNHLKSHTPDQCGINLSTQALSQKPSYRKSISPFINQPKNNSSCTPYFKPKENESLLSITSIEKEDTLCMPYELTEEKPIPTRTIRTSINNPSKNIDLKKGSFSKKQIVSEAGLSFKRENKNNKIMTKSGFLLCDESTTGASRTPSPILLPRNNRCLALSKNFKINRQHLASEADKQYRERSVEKNEEIDAPWISILKDLESAMQIRDFTPIQCCNDRPRVPIKITKA
ncbi:hypothetical protein SteCoe_20336 [Stentor coeruleus]|uniref:Uncharacterized protein n=1 Tax=Stentor coeruleus TaxID=5963 RepID=A0A1R2BS82_9CILI|nr:hypothetical protein SteCoe_20336 [Stentor coeruleus]